MKKLALIFAFLATPTYANEVCIAMADAAQGIAAMQQEGITRDTVKRIMYDKVGNSAIVSALIDNVYNHIPVGDTFEQKDFIIQEVWGMTYKACMK